MVGPDLSQASPSCTLCRGSGWNTAEDAECRCVRRAEASSVEIDASPDLLSDAEKKSLEMSIRRELIDARRTSAEHDAGAIVRAIARGVMPPSVHALAKYARVDDNVAARIMDLVRGAVQTKKKRSRQ